MNKNPSRNSASLILNFPFLPSEKIGSKTMKVAVVGTGINGLVSAYVLSKAGVEVVLFEKEDCKIVSLDNGFDLELSSMVFNPVTYPNIMEFLESFGVEMEASNMSLSVSLDNGRGYEWGTQNGTRSLFAQKNNTLNPYFWRMIQEIAKFKDELFGQPQWLTIKRSSDSYLNKIQKALEIQGCQIRTSSKIHSISSTMEGCIISYEADSQEIFDQCVLAIPAADTLKLLGNQATPEENLGQTSPPFFVTINPEEEPKHVLFKSSIGRLIPSASSLIAQHMVGKSYTLLSNPNHMVPSLLQTGARRLVTTFLARYISIGSLTIMEEGGRMFTIKGIDDKFLPKVVLRVHNPQFYWKIMTRADVGLADSYIDGDFSFVDKNEGLLNLVLLPRNDLHEIKGWWTPPLLTASIAYAKYFFQHSLRQNTITQARRNISRHYDLSNELFSLFLDHTMTYSCAIFKREDEDLSVAQLRKISILIKKARINKNHHILEIGCGWGSLAIEAVKQTGCRYTGITLSEEQFKYAEKKVKDLESVGHEFMEDFFGSCESVLAENGLLVLQAEMT
ncbi:ufaA1, partial [Cucurbita argyrosperma subsp. argyrosperma]